MQMCSKGNCTNGVEFQGVTTEVSWLMQDMLHRLCSFEIYLERVVLRLHAWVTQIRVTSAMERFMYSKQNCSICAIKLTWLCMAISVFCSFMKWYMLAQLDLDWIALFANQCTTLPPSFVHLLCTYCSNWISQLAWTLVIKNALNDDWIHHQPSKFNDVYEQMEASE